jgi:DNA primase
LALETKERIKQATEIVDLIGSHLQLRRSGSSYLGHCPWHDDQRPSLQVNPSRQSWVCWVCNIRGDVFDFVMRWEKVEFFEALTILAERAGIPLTPRQQPQLGSVQDKQTLYRAMQWAVEQFHHHLISADSAQTTRDYLYGRGIDDETIRKFQIGAAPVKWSWLMDLARGTPYGPDILAACDLIYPSSSSGSWVERFRGRLLFPIFDVMNRPVGFGGRLIPGLMPDEKGGKYVNSRESRLYSKSEHLYGLNLVRDAVAKSRELTIVEGYTDAIVAWQAGLPNVVACLGTAINHNHIRLIKRFADRITLVLDGDDAGKKRANEILDLFVASDIDLRITTLPEGMDPCDFIQQNGANEFQTKVQQAFDAIEHKIRVETAGIDLLNETHRAHRALENILATIARIPASPSAVSKNESVLRRQQVLMRLARKFQVDPAEVKKRLLEIRARISLPTRKSSATTGEPPAEIDFSSLSRCESELLQLLIHQPEFLDRIIENIAPSQFVEGPLRDLYSVVYQRHESNKTVTYDELMLAIECPKLKNLLVYLDAQWQQRQLHQPLALADVLMDPVDELMYAFQRLQTDSGSRRTIAQLHQQQLNEKEEVETLEELLEKTRQRHGL